MSTTDKFLLLKVFDGDKLIMNNKKYSTTDSLGNFLNKVEIPGFSDFQRQIARLERKVRWRHLGLDYEAEVHGKYNEDFK